MGVDFHLSPSILSADFADLGTQLDTLGKSGVRALHIDVMDGSFVPQISFGFPVIRSIRSRSDLFFDVHMMVEEPVRFVSDLKDCGADLVTVHAEACRHLDRTLSAIRDQGMMTGLALNPATPLSVLDYVMDKLDMVLVMTVNPGFGGQSYLPAMTRKIREVRKKLDEGGCPDVSIQVDGGINADTLDEVRGAGAGVLVMGSAIFGRDMEKKLEVYRDLLGEF